MSSVDLKLSPITITTESTRQLSVVALSDIAPRSLAREIDRANIIPLHQARPCSHGLAVKYRENTTGHVGGAPYGATTLAGGGGSRQPSETERALPGAPCGRNCRQKSPLDAAAIRPRRIRR
jgi:hypothetical protein